MSAEASQPGQDGLCRVVGSDMEVSVAFPDGLGERGLLEKGRVCWSLARVQAN